MSAMIVTSEKIHFYSHTSREVWQSSFQCLTTAPKFLLTHLSRGVTTAVSSEKVFTIISTHTPLARCDCFYLRNSYIWTISTHTPLARCDGNVINWNQPFVDFYSHTSREVWLGYRLHEKLQANFYSHTSREVWRTGNKKSIRRHYFYSHTSREVWLGGTVAFLQFNLFLLTHLSRGVTRGRQLQKPHITISTHTPLARCDVTIYMVPKIIIDFYSHTSREVWLASRITNAIRTDFYSHTSREVWRNAATDMV